MKNHSISAVNIAFAISVTGLYTIPQFIQEYGPDEILEIGEIEVSEDSMGVDGHLSAGLIFNKVPQTITLAANSDSCSLFDAWYAAEVQIRDKYFCNAIVEIPAIRAVMIFTNGNLNKYSFPSAKKTLQPRKFTINWESVTITPV